MEWLRSHRLPIGSVAVALLTILVLLHYGDLQTAAHADEFRRRLDRFGRPAYAGAAVADVCFAAAYALFAIGCAAGVRGRWRTVALVGAGLVVVGGMLDEVENVLLLSNIARAATVGDDAIDRMTAVGPSKWGIGLAGAVILLVSIGASRMAGRGRSD